MLKIKTFPIISVICLLLASCTQATYEISSTSQNKDLLKSDYAVVDNQYQGTTYAREITQEEALSKRVVNISGKSIELLSVLKDVFPGCVYLPQGPDVNFQKRIDILTPRMSAGEFLTYLERVTGYAFEVKGKTIHVKSYLTKTWNLSTLVDSRGVINSSVTTQSAVSGDNSEDGDEEESANILRIEQLEDSWLDAIRTAEAYLGIESSSGEEEGQGPQVVPQVPIPVDYQTLGTDGITNFQQRDFVRREVFEPFVTSNKSLGIITASGPARKIRELDEIFKRIQRVSQSMFNVQVTVYEVVLDESKQKGINWSLLREGAFGVDNLSLGFDKLFQSTFTSDVFGLNGGYSSDRTQSSAVLKFLETFGEVELLDQPSIMTRNGVPSKIYAGNELTFVGNFNLVTTDSNNVILAPTFDTLKVGVSLAVTARHLDGDKILLDIWPVISSVDGNETFNVNDFEFSVPQRSLKEFATQVVTTSGKSVHLGGLIKKQLSKSLRGLPIKNKYMKGVLDIPFQDVANELERREIVLVVTPTLIKSENI